VIETEKFFLFLSFVNELHVHTLIEQATKYRDDDKPLHAMQLLRRVIAWQPACEHAYVLLAQIYEEARQYKAAEAVLLQGLRHNPKSETFYVVLGSFHLARLEFARALDYFLKIRHRHMPYVHMSLGVAYRGIGKLLQAERELKLAAQADPKLPKVFEVWGEVLLELGRTKDALNVLRRAARLDQYSGSAHHLLADALAAEGQWQSAYEEYLLAVDMNPDDEEAWFNIANALIHLDRLDEAKRYLERYLHLKPNDSTAASVYRSVSAILDTTEGPQPPQPMARHDRN